MLLLFVLLFCSVVNEMFVGFFLLVQLFDLVYVGGKG